MLVAVLAVLRTGAAYVPLDPGFPDERLDFMAADSKLRLVLTQGSLEARWLGRDVPTLRIEDAAMSAAGTDQAPAPGTRGGENTAYMIYTSGSTGKPKGVCVPHRAVVNFLAQHGARAGARLRRIACWRSPRCRSTSRCSSCCCRSSVGAQVVIATRDEAMDGQSLRELIDRHGITLLQATPSTWRLLLESGWHGHRAPQGPVRRRGAAGRPLPATC